jgi:alpha-beta hydrolase superfamily lysophospholipase
MNSTSQRIQSVLAMVVALATAGSPVCLASNAGNLAALTQQATVEGTERLISGTPVATWQPSGNPRAIAVVVHGITANAQCLASVGNALAADGVLTYGVDLRGHGWWYSRVRQAAAGRRCDYDASVHDVDALIVRLHAQHPSLPIFLIGESVGAAVMLRAAVDRSAPIDGIVLCAPGTRCARANPLWVLGDVWRACLGRKIDLSRYQAAYGTEDKVALKQMRHDGGMRTIFSARELIGTLCFIHENDKVAASMPPQLPILMLQGADDRTIRPDSARKLFSELPCKDKRYISVPECGHVLLATPRVKPMVKDSIIGFINQQCSRIAIAAGNSTLQ